MGREAGTILMIARSAQEVVRVKQYLADTGGGSFCLEVVESAPAAARRLSVTDACVLLIDVAMADGDCPELVASIRSSCPALSVVLICDWDDDMVGPPVGIAGVDDYLCRGKFKAGELMRCLRACAELSSLRKRIEELGKQLSDADRLPAGGQKVDQLTGLSTMAGFQEMLGFELKRSQRSGAPAVAILLNMDDFRQVNRVAGHATGDMILRGVAQRLVSSLRSADRIARTGSDEFLILLPETRFAEGLRVGERLRLAVSEGTQRQLVDGVGVTASVGVVPVPAEGACLVEIVSLARLALSASKDAGKNRVAGLEEASGLPEGLDGEQMAAVAEAVRTGSGLRALLLPIVSLSNDEVEGYELLMRGPAGQFELPVDFFRACRDMDLLTLADLACLKVCVAKAVLLARQVVFHVNLYPSTIMEVPHQRLLSVLEPAREAGAWCIELNEQQLIGDPFLLKEKMAELRRAGILFALDDAGFGRSSLETLIILEPDIIKIDRSYVTGAAADAGKRRALERLVRVVQTLGCGIVAEGIESRQEASLLLDLGVKYGQGFLWGRPA